MDPIRRLARLLAIRLTGRRRGALGLHDVARLPGRVWLTDLDELRHMNNGVYLSLLDHARLDLLVRAGAWARIRAARVYPVITAQTISYRRSLTLGQRYTIDSRVIGYDERAVYVEQRIVVGGEVFAVAHVKGRFLRDAGGVVGTAELGAIAGFDPAAHPIPRWLQDWSDAVALPSTRQPAPSTWA